MDYGIDEKDFLQKVQQFTALPEIIEEQLRIGVAAVTPKDLLTQAQCETLRRTLEQIPIDHDNQGCLQAGTLVYVRPASSISNGVDLEFKPCS